MTEGTFALVELLDATGKWVPMYDDDDLCLHFKWSHLAPKIPYSHTTIQWQIPHEATPGTYRIFHFGLAKHIFCSIHQSLRYQQPQNEIKNITGMVIAAYLLSHLSL